MKLSLHKNPADIKALFQAGEVFAYPTEAVFGLGGKPCVATYQKILTLKGRDQQKGVILVVANWAQARPFIGKISAADWQRLDAWEQDGRATTFIFPAAKNVPPELCDQEKGNIAFRVAKHPVVQELCTLCASPLISTSANKSGLPPAKTPEMVSQYFPHLPVITGKIGTEARPSRIIDLLAQKILRD